jgi:hypothetical protein
MYKHDPLVKVYITNWNIAMFNGWINYFYGLFSIAMLNQRVVQGPIHPFPTHFSFRLRHARPAVRGKRRRFRTRRAGHSPGDARRSAEASRGGTYGGAIDYPRDKHYIWLIYGLYMAKISANIWLKKKDVDYMVISANIWLIYGLYMGYLWDYQMVSPMVLHFIDSYWWCFLLDMDVPSMDQNMSMFIYGSIALIDIFWSR